MFGFGKKNPARITNYRLSIDGYDDEGHSLTASEWSLKSLDQLIRFIRSIEVKWGVRAKQYDYEVEEDHRLRHLELHRALDELIADYIDHQPLGGKTLTDSTVMELMEWSHQQTINPTKPQR